MKQLDPATIYYDSESTLRHKGCRAANAIDAMVKKFGKWFKCSRCGARARRALCHAR